MAHKISYAQNGEDIVLHRALGHIERGFYIDIGAYDPVQDSVTKIFYDQKWSGINVEPTPQMFERLCSQRTRDINLDLPVWDREDDVPFFRVGQTGLSTLDPAIAEEARAEGREVDTTLIRTTTLREICRRHVTGDIHFLKVDAEGAEPQVLSGADFGSFRPWIVVVEATKPGTSERNDDPWRGILQRAGYECVLFDGLNLFFLANERGELRPALTTPANVLDRFVTAQHHAAMMKIHAITDGAEGVEAGAVSVANGDMADLLTWHEAVEQERLDQLMQEKIAWHRADAEAGVRRSMEDTIAWNRADAEAGVRRSMEDTIAWNRSDAEAAVHRSMEDTIAWHRLDAEAAVRRAMEDTIAWHRADAAQRAFRSEIDLSATRLREETEQALQQKRIAEETLAFLRREKFTQAESFAAAEAEFHAVRSRYDHDVAELDRAHRELLAWRESVRLSTSWRLTRPLRVCGRLLRRLVHAN